MNFIPNQIDPLSLPFVSFLDRDALPEVTGIYFLLSQLGEVLYVGQAENINRRWRRHHQTPNVNNNHALKIAWVEVDRQFLNQVEAAWISLYCPPLNGSIPIARNKALPSSLTPAQLRSRVGMTQDDFAIALGKSLSTISKWEQGTHKPSLTLPETRRLLTVLRCTLDEAIEAFENAGLD